MFFRTPALALTALSLAAPVAAQEVNIYSYRQPDLVAPVLDAFTKKTDITVNLVYLNDGMIERLKAEGRRSPADIVLTSDVARLEDLSQAGLLQPVDDPALFNEIPAEFRDKDGMWFGLTTRARVVYASKERVADGEVTTYEDLTDPRWKGRICTRSGTHDYNLALTAAMILHHGQETTEEWLRGVKANLARKPQGNDRAQVKAIWSGECDISLGNTYYMGQMLADPEQTEWANSVRIVFPVFEGGGTHVNSSGMAMTLAAPHKEDALKLMEFLASPEAQQIYAQQVYEYPVAPGVAPDPLVASWGQFARDGLPLAELSTHRGDALRLTEAVDFDGN